MALLLFGEKHVEHFNSLNPLNPSIVALKYIEYGFGYFIIRSPYSPYSIYLLGITHRRYCVRGSDKVEADARLGPWYSTHWGNIRVILGLYWDSGKGNGN